MAGSRSEFIIKTLMFCLILFSLTIFASALALSARDSLESYDTNETGIDPYIPDGIDINETANASELTDTSYDVTGIFYRVAEILTMYSLPMPFPLIFIIWNVILITVIVYCIVEYVKSCIPFTPGG